MDASWPSISSLSAIWVAEPTGPPPVECRTETAVAARPRVRTSVFPGTILLLAPVLLTAFAAPAAGEPISANTITLLDTLGPAAPSTVFSVFGIGGLTIGDGLVGPRFDITAPTVVTHVGGFVNNCRTIIASVPDCPNTLPLVVHLRPSVAGAPDPSTLLASFTLSHDDDPLRVSFESASLRLLLAPGSYFALFGAQGNDTGFLLTSASDPFSYVAGSTDMGFMTASGAVSASPLFGAVRILGEPASAPVPEPSTLTLLSIGIAAAGWRKRGMACRALPRCRTFAKAR